MVSEIPILQTCNVAVPVKRDWLRSNICAVLRCRHLLDAEISVLNSILNPKSTACQSVSFAVLLGIDPSKNSSSNCHFVFQPSLEFHPGVETSGIIHFHHCVKLSLSNAQGCQTLKRGSRFHGVVTNPVVLFLETGSPAKSLVAVL